MYIEIQVLNGKIKDENKRLIEQLDKLKIIKLSRNCKLRSTIGNLLQLI
ncbi:hypothetical protein [Clostridium lundense]|nr:hypothetical protein [Clostridium lundense]